MTWDTVHGYPLGDQDNHDHEKEPYGCYAHVPPVQAVGTPGMRSLGQPRILGVVVRDVRHGYTLGMAALMATLWACRASEDSGLFSTILSHKATSMAPWVTPELL